MKKDEKDMKVLVIGAGLAGIRAALEASKYVQDVILVAKGKFGMCGSSFSELGGGWGVQAASEELGDSVEEYLNEIIDIGQNTVEQELAEILAHESYERFLDLVNLSVKFKPKELRRKGCFSDTKRAFVLADKNNLKKSLYNAIKGNGINLLENLCLVRLIIKDKVCHGALFIKNDGDFIQINSLSTILATGGGAGIFERSLAPANQIGLGYVLAYEEGCSLKNMEFIQIMLGTVARGRVDSSEGISNLEDFFPLKLLHLMPKVLNSNGAGFLLDYYRNRSDLRKSFIQRATHGPFSTSDSSKFIDISISSEILNGRGTESDGVVFKFSSDSRKFREDYFEVSPFAHAFNGGISIDKFGGTEIDSLFACGEVAGGMHGADRLGGNMITATQVFGKRAGERAGKNAGDRKSKRIEFEIDRFKDTFSRSTGVSAEELGKRKAELKRLLWRNCLVIRNEDGLNSTIKKMSELRDWTCNIKIKDFRGFIILEEVRTISKLGMIIANAMLSRRESRGSHYREDFPEKNEGYEK